MVRDHSVLRHYLAPLQRCLDPDDVTELVVNRPGEFALERAGGWEWRRAPELTETWLATLARAAAAYTAQDITAEAPICSTVLPNGERCQIVLPPAAERVSLTLRKPSAPRLDLDAFANNGLFDAVELATPELSADEKALLALRDAGDWRGFFRLAIRSRRNVLISGATGSGKTTFAKSLVRLIPPDERLLTIEDARELTVPHRNAVHLLYAKDGQGLAKIDAKQLLESALRMRPDRILLQELRDGTAFFYLRTVNTGHPGSITTIHADSAALAFEQLTLLVKESEGGRDLARADVRALLHVLVDVVVQMRRVDGRFRVTEVWYDPLRKRALAA
jgi:type IV secretion system protein VirB11